MNTKKMSGLVQWVLLSLLVVGGALVMTAFFWTMSVNKGEIILANRYEAQFNVRETSMDAMRKTLTTQFKVTRAFADDFVKVAVAQSEGRKGGSLFKSNTEAANQLGIDPTLYAKMLNSVEGLVDGFKRSQDTLTDVWREHKTYCEDPYHNMLWISLVGKAKPKPEMISSVAVKDAIKTGVMDDNLLPE